MMLVSQHEECFPEANAALKGPGRRLHGAVTHKLGFEIVSGQYSPGASLHGEVLLAKKLQISRGAVRETLQVLAAKGLIESRPRSGTRVLPRSRWNLLDADVLRWAFMGKPDMQMVRDIFELRASIEPAAAELAATRRTSSDLATIRRILSKMGNRDLSLEAGREADCDFHRAILRATANGAIIALSPGICAAVAWMTDFKRMGRGNPRDAMPDHVRVLEAITVRDPRRARTSMEILIALALEDTKHVLG